MCRRAAPPRAAAAMRLAWPALRLASPSVWQHAQRAWRDAGVEWQRPGADWEPAEAEWERVQAAPFSKRRGAVAKAAWPVGAAAGKLSSRLSARSLTRSLGGQLEPASSVTVPPGAGSQETAVVPAAAARPQATTVSPATVSPTTISPSPPMPQGPAVPPGPAVTRAPAAAPPSPAVRPPSAPAGPSFRRPGRGWHVRREVWLAALAVIVVIVLVVAGFLVFGGGGPARSGGAGAYPPARLAGADFTGTPGQQARGIFQTVSGVAASGSTVVAVGSQAGQWVPRAQFFVSADGGRGWRLAAVRGPGGAAPSPADIPLLVTGGAPLPGGRGGWLALGTGAAWTSPDGKTWTLAPGAGISPMQASDRVLALARTSSGFLAVGENVPGGDQAKSPPVAWTSATGLNWRRLSGGGLSLAVPSGRVTQLTRVAARGSHVIIEGANVKTRGRGKQRATSVVDRVWLSTDGGSSWVPTHLPVGTGAVNLIDGVAATGSGFVAIRPGRSSQTGSDALAYVSAGGSFWSRAAAITVAKNDHLKVTAVGGSDQGAVVSGQVTAGATVTTGGTVVAAGATVRSADGQRPYLVLAGP